MDLSVEKCRECKGSGKVVNTTCKRCHGLGFVYVEKTNQFNYCGYCGTPLNKQPVCPKCGRMNK